MNKNIIIVLLCVIVLVGLFTTIKSPAQGNSRPSDPEVVMLFMLNYTSMEPDGISVWRVGASAGAPKVTTTSGAQAIADLMKAGYELRDIEGIDGFYKYVIMIKPAGR